MVPSKNIHEKWTLQKYKNKTTNASERPCLVLTHYLIVILNVNRKGSEIHEQSNLSDMDTNWKEGEEVPYNKSVFLR